MKKTYFSQCAYCGARLDPGERCDCRKAKLERKPVKTIKNTEREKAS